MTLTKAKLTLRQELVFFDIVNESMINHLFKYLTDCIEKTDWSVAVCVSWRFASFQNGDYFSCFKGNWPVAEFVANIDCVSKPSDSGRW